MFPIKRFVRPLLWLAMVVLFMRGNCQRRRPLPSPAPSTAVLMDFYADWCGPCRSMAPGVESLAQAGYLVERINIDRQPELAHRYGVGAVPCYIVVEQGREIDRVTGVTTIERLKLKLGTRGRGTRGEGIASHSSPGLAIRTSDRLPSRGGENFLLRVCHRFGQCVCHWLSQCHLGSSDRQRRAGPLERPHRRPDGQARRQRGETDRRRAVFRQETRGAGAQDRCGVGLRRVETFWPA